MDIELLSKMVGELVRDHSEVGLPGLGTFVSEFVPASFSDRGYTINPPYKRVTFVPGTATDNSLVDLYASSNGIDADQARAVLLDFLEGTKKVLMDRRTVVFPGLGRLRVTRQNNIFFITDETLDIYPEGFGLGPVSLKNHEETPAELHHAVESLADILVVPAEELPALDEDNLPIPADEEPDLQKEPKMTVAPDSEEGLPAKSAENDGGSGHSRKERRAAAKAAKAERKAARARRRASRKPVNKWVWLAPLLVVALAAFAAAAFLILVQVAPDFIDSLLYTPEELRIINY